MIILTIIILLIAYYCFHEAFYASRRPPKVQEEFEMPPGEIYEPYHPAMRQWMKEVRAMPFEELSITSFDGLKLYGKYYEYKPGAPIELMLHGYRGSAERDLCGGVQRAFALGHNVLIVDQRTACKSEGKVITFGIHESKDCLRWIDRLAERFGREVPIILTGISMGAATVLIAAGQELPKNVIGVLADCGYTTAREMIQKTIGEMHLPPKLAYPFVKLGARLFGRFNLEETAPIEAIRNCKVPVLFFHGDADDFVPCEMSRRLYEACPTRKKLVIIPGAGHGLAYPADPENYLKEMRGFFHE
ncbi:MAG: alpha/beta fold hydrolase [Clostridia bacterium]|nr:alpha/beta fold hydrolase [Clostridia bacterium]